MIRNVKYKNFKGALIRRLFLSAQSRFALQEVTVNALKSSAAHAIIWVGNGNQIFDI